MTSVNLADAKARLSELISKAEGGETIDILRRGKRVASLTPAQKERKPIDLAMLRSLTEGMQVHEEMEAGTLIRTLRDSDRY